MALAGVRLSSDRPDWLVWMVVGAWLTGAAGCIYDSWWLTALPSQIIVRLIIITGIACAGVWLPDDRVKWSNWAVIGMALLGVAIAIYWYFGFYYRFWASIFELALVAGLAATAIAGIWRLNDHTDRLTWATGAWLIGVAGYIILLYKRNPLCH